MAKRTRIYTRAGDDGTTGLVGGHRVSKSGPRIETYGTLDELSSAIGLARAHLAREPALAPVDAWLAWTQDVLFDAGSALATLPEDRAAATPRVGADAIAALERAIDRSEDALEPLNAFILPGGSVPGAALHFARTVCRRAERLLVALREREPDIPAELVRFLNRLSDALFVWARRANAELRAPEQRWNQHSQPPFEEGQ